MEKIEIEEDVLVDARQLSCPMPVVKSAKAMRTLELGQVLKLLATDRGSIKDVPAWAQSTSNTLLGWHEDDGTLVYYVRKGTEG